MADEEQVEEAQVEGEEGEEEEGGGKKKLIIMIAAAVILLIGGGAGLYFSGILGGGGDDAEVTDEHGDGHAEEGTADEHATAADDGGHGETDGGGDAHGESGGGGGGHGEEGGAGGSLFLPIPTIIVNLNTQDGTPRYLRLTVQLELVNPSQAPAVEAVMPRVIDQFQTYLRELRVKDLRGSAGIYRLQMELLWRVNKAAHPIKVKDVLFQEILIQ